MTEFVVSRLFWTASHVPGARLLAGTILDTLFGPEDDFDYVSTTQPTAPPPSHGR